MENLLPDLNPRRAKRRGPRLVGLAGNSAKPNCARLIIRLTPNRGPECNIQMHRPQEDIVLRAQRPSTDAVLKRPAAFGVLSNCAKFWISTR